MLIRPSNQQSGFTLVELIMVLTLMVFLTATIAPRFFKSSSVERVAFFEEIKTVFAFAKDSAISSGCNTQVVFDQDEDEDGEPVVAILRDSVCSIGKSPSYIALNRFASDESYQVPYPDDVAIAESVNDLIFYASGHVCSDEEMQALPNSVVDAKKEIVFVDSSDDSEIKTMTVSCVSGVVVDETN